MPLRKPPLAAGNQVRELQFLREPKAIARIRIPEQHTGENQVKYGRGDNQYRSGTPIYLDVWNVSGPTIMVLNVLVKITDSEATDTDPMETLMPQVLVESGKVVSINIGYRLMRQISGEFIDFPSGTTANAHFVVDYFSVGGERVAEADAKFKFIVDDNHIRVLTNSQ